MRDIGKLGKYEAKFGEETEHLPGYRLDVVLSANDNKSCNLVTYEYLIADRHRILYAI